MAKTKLELIVEKYDVDTKYDELNLVELEKRLKRKPTKAEVINSDNDSDLVNEVMWQLVKDMAQKLSDLETKLAGKSIV